MTGDEQVQRGFTLVEVLIAMAITALVSVVAYSGLSAALSGAESLRSSAARSHDLQQTLGLLSRDLRQVVNRPVIDEFGQRVPALTGGELAQTMLSLSRGRVGITLPPRRGALCSGCAGGWKRSNCGVAISPFWIGPPVRSSLKLR